MTKRSQGSFKVRSYAPREAAGDLRAMPHANCIWPRSASPQLEGNMVRNQVCFLPFRVDTEPKQSYASFRPH